MDEADGFGNKKGVTATGDVFYMGVPTVEYDDRREKPWQRVFYKATKKGTHLYEPVKSIPCAFLILLLGTYLLLGYLAQLVEDEMPNVVKDSDVRTDDSTTFSEESAWRYIMTILGDQPRVSGTLYHYQKTQDLKALVDSIAARSNIPIRTDWQLVSGDYMLAFALPHVNLYQNASNVIAMLEGSQPEHSLLLNCHYDSVPFALGVSDNTIFCGVMMEVLNKLSRRNQRLRHNIIFLFNGAEENPLQGSHGFLKHEWSRNIKNVINMDAAGMNGKPTIFQVTDPRVLRAYKRTVKRPSGQGVAEFLFSSGIIPSDTDFRIFRDFGNIHGIDIAFSKWAMVYHTRYDHPSLVLPGVVQNAGDMLLALVPEVADDAAMEEKIEPTAAVYFDYLYWFMVSYSYQAAVAIDFFVAIFGFTSVAYFVWLIGPRRSTVIELMYSVSGRFASLAVGVIVAAVFVAIQVATTVQLRYLSEPWLVVPLYWMPYIITAVCTSHAFDAWRTRKSGLNRSIRTLQAQAATRLIFSFVLLVMTCIPPLATIRYLFTVPLFIMSMFGIVSLTVVRYVKLQAWKQLVMEVLFTLPNTLFLLCLALRLSAILLPIMGRNSSDNPDYTVALVSIGLAILISCSMSGVELLFSRKRLWMVIGPVAITCLVLMFIPFNPYRDDGPTVQRHYWFHSEIISYDFNGLETDRVSGVVVTKNDAYNVDSVLPALRDKSIQLNSRRDFTADCARHVHCNLPLFRVRFGVYLPEALFLYTSPPTPFESSLRVANRTCVGETCVLTFIMTGPPHNLLTLHPRANVTARSWSLSSPFNSTFNFLGRPVYIIVHSYPTWSEVFEPLTFTVTFDVPLSLQGQPIVDVAHHAHKIHHPQEFTDEYRTLVEAMPKYFHIASNLSFRKNYVF